MDAVSLPIRTIRVRVTIYFNQVCINRLDFAIVCLRHHHSNILQRYCNALMEILEVSMTISLGPCMQLTPVEKISTIRYQAAKHARNFSQIHRSTTIKTDYT